MKRTTSWHEYFLSICEVVSDRSSCSRRKLGAVIVMDRDIISTGYNGTPKGMKNCNEGGCIRCNDSNAGTMSNYDLCVCVHAEENAIALAARNGTMVKGSIMYCTTRPCLNCLKLIIQSGIVCVRYEIEHIYPDQKTEEFFQSFVKDSGIGFVRHDK